MKAYERILLAVDFDICAEVVCARGAELAGLYGAKVTLLHVVEPIVMDSAYDVLPVISPALEDELGQHAQAQLDQLVEKAGLGEVNRLVVTGATKGEILRNATELEIDLVVVGSRGRHGIGWLLGSTASGIMQGARCDVLAVHVGEGA